MLYSIDNPPKNIAMRIIIEIDQDKQPQVQIKGSDEQNAVTTTSSVAVDAGGPEQGDNTPEAATQLAAANSNAQEPANPLFDKASATSAGAAPGYEGEE
jgi:hypothetical protein